MEPDKKTQATQTGLNNPPDAGQDSDIPDISVKLSRKSLIKIFLVCFAIAALVISGFLYYMEMRRAEIGSENITTAKQQKASEKNYKNDYWGFTFNYPGYWWPVIGSFEEGDYFFSSEAINFISEQEPDQALLEVKTYNNLKSPTFEDWLIEQETNYFPRWKLISKNIDSFKIWQKARYFVILNKPINNNSYMDMVIISKNGKKMYEFMLLTRDEKIHDLFKGTFDGIIDTVDFYEGYGA